MPAVTADTLTLPRLDRPASGARGRGVAKIVTAHRQSRARGSSSAARSPAWTCRWPTRSCCSTTWAPSSTRPGEAKGAPWHPHRGFETVTYMIDGAFEHQDSTGGGGLHHRRRHPVDDRRRGILHSELPPQELVARGGLFHGVQLWVNLPRRDKWTPPRYQDIGAGDVTLLSQQDGGALVRVIAGDARRPPRARRDLDADHLRPRHARARRASCSCRGRRDFNALVYVLAGRGTVGSERRPLDEGQLAVFGAGEALGIRAADRSQDYAGRAGWEVLLLGGLPIREPIARYGPFVMNTQEEILQAIEDYQAGRLGVVQPEQVPHQTAADEELRT